MNNFPKPPGHVDAKPDVKPLSNRELAHVTNRGAPIESEPVKEPMHKDDVTWILDTTLSRTSKKNPRVTEFILKYMKCRDVAQAAKEAGIKPGMGKDWFNRRDINDAINRITRTAILKYDLEAEQIVERVKEIAFVDPAAVFRADGTCIENMNEIPPEVRRTIKKFEVKNLYEKDPNGMAVVVGKLIKVEMWDKLKSAELLGREVNIFKETVVQQHDLTNNMRDVLLEAGERAERMAIEARKEIAGTIDVTPRTDNAKDVP